jgi:hypothetical protein
MNRLARIRCLAVGFVALLILLGAACQKQKAAPVEEAAPVEHAAPSPAGTSETVLHKTFTLKSSATFPFEIPPHAVSPHLHGIFESFVREIHGASDDSANVDFVIVNADQYADLEGNRPSEALFSVEASHNQSVNVDLPASLDQPAKYYLIFRNSPGKGLEKVVEADFHVDF